MGDWILDDEVVALPVDEVVDQCVTKRTTRPFHETEAPQSIVAGKTEGF